MADILARVRLRRATAAQWASINPVLASGEPGFETDTKILRIGDGVTAFNALGSLPLTITATAAEINALAGIDGNVQDQLDTKQPATTIVGGTGISVENGSGVGGSPTVSFSGSIGATGITATADADGTVATGTTYRPTPVTGNFKTITNAGAFTFAAPNVAGDYSLIVLLTNAAGAGAVTFSGFTKSAGDPLTTTNGHRFMFSIVKLGTSVLVTCQGLQ